MGEDFKNYNFIIFDKQTGDEFEVPYEIQGIDLSIEAQNEYLNQEIITPISGTIKFKDNGYWKCLYNLQRVNWLINRGLVPFPKKLRRRIKSLKRKMKRLKI